MSHFLLITSKTDTNLGLTGLLFGQKKSLTLQPSGRKHLTPRQQTISSVTFHTPARHKLFYYLN